MRPRLWLALWLLAILIFAVTTTAASGKYTFTFFSIITVETPQVKPATQQENKDGEDLLDESSKEEACGNNNGDRPVRK